MAAPLQKVKSGAWPVAEVTVHTRQMCDNPAEEAVRVERSLFSERKGARMIRIGSFHSICAAGLLAICCMFSLSSPSYAQETAPSSPLAGQGPGAARTQTFILTADKDTYYEGENFYLHLSVAQPGAQTPSIMDPCATFYLRETLPGGETRVEKTTPGWICSPADGGSAQGTVGRLSGTVLGANYAVIPGARVTITNNVTGVSRPPIATDSTGFYVAEDLPQGTYTVTVEAKGFKKTSVTGNTVMTGWRMGVDVTMGVDAAMEPDDWQSGLQLYSDATGRGVPGEYTFEVFQVAASSDDSQIRPAQSNILHIQIADPSTIPRKWGPKVKGLAADVTLDKDTFRLGEDVPLHIAIENFGAEVPVSSAIPMVPSVVEIEVRDAEGQPVPISGRFHDPFNYVGRYAAMRYPKGEVVPLERTLWRDGWLPNRSGTYTVVVTWATWDDSKNESASSGSTRLGPAPAPYATARATATIHILDRDNSSSK